MLPYKTRRRRSRRTRAIVATAHAFGRYRTLRRRRRWGVDCFHLVLDLSMRPRRFEFDLPAFVAMLVLWVAASVATPLYAKEPPQAQVPAQQTQAPAQSVQPPALAPAQPVQVPSQPVVNDQATAPANEHAR